ncbi:MAG: cytochrome c [Pseudomonadales bacterium]|nr:cytochrome c [Pseudomonadales bacterium]
MAVILFLLTILCPAFSAAQSGEPSSVLAGAYTEAQAIRGQALYYQHCLACHGEMMNGVDQAPPLAGPQFIGIWKGEPLWALVERIQTMPPEKPGTLSRQENVDILSYVLWYNGLPLGNVPLGTNQDVLAEMLFATP